MRAAGGWYAANLVKAGEFALTAPAAHIEVQAVRGHWRTRVGVLFGPTGVDQLQAGVSCAGDAEQVDQGLAPPGVVLGPLPGSAVLEVLLGAFVETLLHHHWPRVVFSWEGMGRHMVSVPGRCVRHRKAAPVPLPEAGCVKCYTVARRGLLLAMGCPGALNGVVEHYSERGQSPGYTLDLPGMGILGRGSAPSGRCHGRISLKILVASARTEAARRRRRVPIKVTAACWHRVGTLISPRALLSCRLSRKASKA